MIGPIATPDAIIITNALPKVRAWLGALCSLVADLVCAQTRSGKIMRRLLRKIASHETSAEQLGDTSCVVCCMLHVF
jgi:acyl-coenzyme A synthetase/AMP-(fatty) acid ligase